MHVTIAHTKLVAGMATLAHHDVVPDVVPGADLVESPFIANARLPIGITTEHAPEWITPDGCNSIMLSTVADLTANPARTIWTCVGRTSAYQGAVAAFHLYQRQLSAMSTGLPLARIAPPVPALEVPVALGTPGLPVIGIQHSSSLPALYRTELRASARHCQRRPVSS